MKDLFEIFECRAAIWEGEQGEAGAIVAKEIRTVNKAWQGQSIKGQALKIVESFERLAGASDSLSGPELSLQTGPWCALACPPCHFLPEPEPWPRSVYRPAGALRPMAHLHEALPI